MNNPTSRSHKPLRDLGYAAAVVERRVPGKPITIDLFGCIDLVAVDERGRIAWVQTTTASNMASRRNKLKDNDIQPFLAMNGNRVILNGWKKTNGRWQVKEEVMPARTDERRIGKEVVGRL